MEFIAKNYFLIIIIAAFLLFALIGYIVDSEKRKNKKLIEPTKSQENVKEERNEKAENEETDKSEIPEIEEGIPEISDEEDQNN